MERNIICGESAAGCLRQYLKQYLDIPAETVLAFPDNLSFGPLLPIHDGIEKFASARLDFWRNNTFDTFYAECISTEFQKFFPAVASAEKITLWLGPGAQDQFMWAWLTHLFEIYKIDWKNVEIKHLFNTPTRKFRYITLGELSPEKFALCEDCEVTEAGLAALHETYAALSNPSPEQLIAIGRRHISPLAELHAAVKAYLKEYPDHLTGLNIFEKVMLSACADRRLKSARIVAQGLIADKEYNSSLAFHDAYLFHRLIKLSRLNQPLISLFGTVKDNNSMRFTEVMITDTGKKVLNGEANNALLNGINEYIGGVRIDSESGSPIWFYKDGSLIHL